MFGSAFSDKPDDHLYTVQELANKCKGNIETIILSEANLDKSHKGAFSYKFGSYEEEDFVNGIFDEVVNDQTELEKHMINIEIVKSAGHSIASENPKGLAEAINRDFITI